MAQQEEEMRIVEQMNQIKQDTIKVKQELQEVHEIMNQTKIEEL